MTDTEKKLRAYCGDVSVDRAANLPAVLSIIDTLRALAPEDRKLALDGAQEYVCFHCGGDEACWCMRDE